MNLNLSSEEFYLLKLIASEFFIIKKTRKTYNGYLLEITEEDAANIRDLCGEQLQKYGFDKEYSLTDKGQILESLIDKLYT